MSERRERPDVNHASLEQLVAAGVSADLAVRIVDHRSRHGPIQDESELYLVVRDNEIRLDQLLAVVEIGEGGPRQGYST